MTDHHEIYDIIRHRLTLALATSNMASAIDGLFYAVKPYLVGEPPLCPACFNDPDPRGPSACSSCRELIAIPSPSGSDVSAYHYADQVWHALNGRGFYLRRVVYDAFVAGATNAARIARIARHERAALESASADRIDALYVETSGVMVVGSVPMLLWCPGCHARHVDAGEFATKPHHTHACQACGFTWRPAVIATVGVQFLPGFKDEEKK